MNFSLIDVFVIPLLFYTLLYCQSPAKETAAAKAQTEKEKEQLTALANANMQAAVETITSLL